MAAARRTSSSRGEPGTKLRLGVAREGAEEPLYFELEREIVALKVPDLDVTLSESVVRVVNALRAMPLRKAPSVSETLDWARTLVALGADTLTADVVSESLGVILKHTDDIDKARTKLDLDAVLS